jgi:cobalt-precorrin 5A hydrolase
MRTAVIVLRKDRPAEDIASFLGADIIEHSEDAFARAFRERERIVAIMAIGIVVRSLAPLLKDKWVDPAVVVVSPDLCFAVPVLGGHHGANELARLLTPLGITPVITTASECMGREAVENVAARKGLDVLNRASTREVNAAVLRSDVPFYALTGPAMAAIGPGVSVLLKKGEYIVGLGCNRGTSAAEIEDAVRSSLTSLGIQASEVLAYATTEKKRDEAGLAEAVGRLSGCLVYLDDEDINSQQCASPSKASIIGLNGVAAPAALALAKRKELVMEKKASGNVTVAVAR